MPGGEHSVKACTRVNALHGGGSSLDNKVNRRVIRRRRGHGCRNGHCVGDVSGHPRGNRHDLHVGLLHDRIQSHVRDQFGGHCKRDRLHM